MNLIIYTDGGARGNPGPAGIGIVIYKDRRSVFATYSDYIGEATNNQAEYRAVIFAIEKAKEMKAKNLDFFLDSELVVKQLRGQYKVKNPDLILLVQKIFRLSNNFSTINYHYIPREKNQLADKLVNQALDEQKNRPENIRAKKQAPFSISGT